jgi:hypothetical protein
LVGRVIASYYAEPVAREIERTVTLRQGPSAETDELAELTAGASFDMLENSRGWAWGYAGTDRRVGYVPSEAVGL